MSILKRDTLKTSIPKGSLVKNYDDLLKFVKQNSQSIYNSDNGLTVEDIIKLNFFQDENTKKDVNTKTLFNSQIELEDYENVQQINERIRERIEHIKQVEQIYNRGLFFNYILQSKAFVNFRYNKLDIKQMFVDSQQIMNNRWKTFYQDKQILLNNVNKTDYHHIYPLLFVSNILQVHHGVGQSFIEFSLGGIKLKEDEVGFRVSFQNLYLYDKINRDTKRKPVYGKILFLPEHNIDTPNPPWGRDFSKTTGEEPINMNNVGLLTGVFGWTDDNKKGQVNNINVDVVLPEQGFSVYGQDGEVDQVITFQKMKNINMNIRMRLQFDVDYKSLFFFRVLKIEPIKEQNIDRIPQVEIIPDDTDYSKKNKRQNIMMPIPRASSSKFGTYVSGVGNYIQIDLN